MKKGINNCLTAVALQVLFFSQLAFAEQIITNPPRPDGFGAQFQSIIQSVIYAELKQKRFLYTPFKTMEHNYDNDPDFIQKKEQLINFIGNFEINQDPTLQTVSSQDTYTRFFEANLAACANSQSLKKIKSVFRSNKSKNDYFDAEHLHVAIHIRRANPHDTLNGRPPPTERYLAMKKYIAIIEELRRLYVSKNPLFHIYSQGEISNFDRSFRSNDIVFHINTSVEETFASMVLADALVTSTSSLSYVAGILSEGTVYYIPFWHPPLPSWTIMK